MNSEENTIKLIAMLDKTVDEIEKLDQRLQFYQDKMTVKHFFAWKIKKKNLL
jgi:hypothetical protein